LPSFYFYTSPSTLALPKNGAQEEEAQAQAALTLMDALNLKNVTATVQTKAQAWQDIAQHKASVTSVPVTQLALIPMAVQTLTLAIAIVDLGRSGPVQQTEMVAPSVNVKKNVLTLWGAPMLIAVVYIAIIKERIAFALMMTIVALSASAKPDALLITDVLTPSLAITIVDQGRSDPVQQTKMDAPFVSVKNNALLRMAVLTLIHVIATVAKG
jgi:hypothetical protein